MGGDEFVAAHARHRVGAPHGRLQPPADLAQQLVADGVAPGVVDLLEVVHVDHRDQHARSLALQPAGGLRETVFQQLAVGQAGQRIAERLVVEPVGERARLQRGRHHLRHQAQADHEVFAPVDVASHRVEADEAVQRGALPERDDQDRADALAFEFGAFIHRLRWQVGDAGNLEGLVGPKSLHQPREGVERHVLQVVGLARDAGGHPFVRVALRPGGVVDEEDVGTIDFEERADGAEDVDDRIVERAATGTDESRRRPGEQSLEGQASLQLRFDAVPARAVVGGDDATTLVVLGPDVEVEAADASVAPPRLVPEGFGRCIRTESREQRGEQPVGIEGGGQCVARAVGSEAQHAPCGIVGVDERASHETEHGDRDHRANLAAAGISAQARSGDHAVPESLDAVEERAGLR